MTTWFSGSIFSRAAWLIIVGREFGRELAAVREAPKKLRRLAAARQTHETEIDRRGVLHIFEILARAGDEEVFSIQLRAGKAWRDFSQNGATKIKI